ncbi:PQQ-binding-like beta-propeller repeat protein [Paludibaculum fermentans]|uniref:outer membrane protein assembly factor BamB family protein n=1 Tax=Paludibaculum fermentans TaxID=1473598 RepID=UPI003EBBD620
MSSSLRTSTIRAAAGVACISMALFAQTAPLRPLRTAPSEKFTVNPGFRDWGPASLAGTTILAGSPTGRGGLFAVDMATGKLKWSHRPVFSTGTASVSTPPAVAGGVVITPYAAAYPGAVVAVSLETGKELWRGLDPVQGAAVAVSGDLAFILAKNGTLYALDVATGRERWKTVLSARRAGCATRPVVREGTIYLTADADETPGDKAKPAGSYLFALDARTGQERWRYRAVVPDEYSAACLRQPVVTSDTVFAAGGTRLYAVDRATGTDRWKSIEVRRPVEGREHGVEVHGLVEAGSLLIGMTPGSLIAFEKDSGRTAWDLPGQFYPSAPSMAVAGNVLYFQGSPQGKPAAVSRGTLYALDLDTRSLLWSFSRPTAEANWPFGFVTPVDGGLWVDSYQALVKLQ